MMEPRIGTLLFCTGLTLVACSKPSEPEARPPKPDETKTAASPLTAAPPAAAPPAPSPKPDYADPNSWLCRPGHEDACDADLSTTVIQANGKLSKETWKANPAAKVDCFYVYPTVSSDPTPNSDMLPGNEERGVVRSQAARFASQCRLFAPLYRQTTLTALRASLRGTPMNADRGLGYSDVAAAWKYYLEHDNQGRGVVLIGHSQGSSMLLQLAQNEIDGKPVQKQLISALLIGTNVTVAKGKDVGGSFKSIPLCHAPTQLGCAISYASFRSNVPPPATSRFAKSEDPTQEAACTNPAALGGGSGVLHAHLSNARMMSTQQPAPWVKGGKPIETPFVSVPGLLTAKCVKAARGSYLAVEVHGKASDPRVDDIVGDVITDGKLQADWGLHMIDMGLAMGNLVELVGKQAKRYLSQPHS